MDPIQNAWPYYQCKMKFYDNFIYFIQVRFVFDNKQRRRYTVVLPAVHFCWKKVVVVAGNLPEEKNKLMKNHNQGWIVYRIDDVDDGY